MVVVQNCGGMECQGEIVAKGNNRTKAFENFKKKCSWYWDPSHDGSGNAPVVTFDNDYIYINGEAEYEFTDI